MTRIINERIMRWKKRQRKRVNCELTVLLDKDSHERFDRLKAKIPAFDNAEMIASALKCLEQRTDRIIKRQVMKKIRALNNEGYDFQQTSDYLNKKKVLPLAGTDKWDAETISTLLNKEKRGLADKVKDTRHKNHQPEAF